MKKKVLGLALVAMSMVSFGAFAQQPEQKKCNKEGKECKARCKAEKPGRNPFEGINLTESQKTQIQQLKESRKAAKEQQKAERQKDRQKNLEARKAAKKQYLQDMKSILGPDNYVVFLENIVVNQPNGGKAMKAKGHKGHKMNKDGKNGKGSRDNHHAFRNNQAAQNS